jgi:hypothetical protein
MHLHRDSTTIKRYEIGKTIYDYAGKKAILGYAACTAAGEKAITSAGLLLLRPLFFLPNMRLSRNDRLFISNPSLPNQTTVMHAERSSISLASLARCLFFDLTVLQLSQSRSARAESRFGQKERLHVGVSLVGAYYRATIRWFLFIKICYAFREHLLHACTYKPSQRLRSTVSLASLCFTLLKPDSLAFQQYM